MFEKRKDSSGSVPVSSRASLRTDSAAAVSRAVPQASSGRRADAAKATIGPTLVVKGDLSSDEDLVIAGEFEGSIDVSNVTLTITASGRVHADVKANVVEIEGEVAGDVNGLDKVVIAKTGRMEGNIISPRVILDDGAKFRGRIDMNSEHFSKPARPSPKPAASGPRPAANSAAPDTSGTSP